MSSNVKHCDVLIVGGGLVGSALANTLRQLPLSVMLAESHDVRALDQPGFDARATALANGTRQILSNLALWDDIAAEVEPITDIHVSESGRFGVARINANEEGVAALGYTVENRSLGAALWGGLSETERFRVAAPAKFLGMTADAETAKARIDVGGAEQIIEAKLVVAADGARSGLRESLGLGVRHDDYGQTAVIFNCRPVRPLNGLAIERFTTNGPLAVLPLPRQRAGIVWTVAGADAPDLLALDDTTLAQRLDGALGGRLGAVERIGVRASFPLHRIRAERLFASRTVLLGSAAVNLHPVAGQGFNLAMRDIAWLAEVLADEMATLANGGDIGCNAVLSRYSELRGRDQAGVAGLTHGLIRVFGVAAPGAGRIRGLGLVAFDTLPGARRLFARHAMGRAGRAPRLVCGQPLYSAADPRIGS